MLYFLSFLSANRLDIAIDCAGIHSDISLNFGEECELNWFECALFVLPMDHIHQLNAVAKGTIYCKKTFRPEIFFDECSLFMGNFEQFFYMNVTQLGKVRFQDKFWTNVRKFYG